MKPRPRSAVVLAAVIVAATAAPATAAYAPGELLYTFRDTAIVESSGVASSAASDAVLFTHNDSGDGPRFFAVGTLGRTLATFQVSGARAVDWEDMAAGPGSAGGRALYLGDIGDNPRARPFISVFEVPEPAVDTGSTGVFATVAPTAEYVLLYADGPRDAETLLVDPRDGSLAIVSKESSGRSGVYVARAPFETLPMLLVLERSATIRFDLLGSPTPPGGNPTSRLLSTGGDVAPDASRFAVRTYLEAFEWTIPAAGTLADAVSAPPLRVALPATQQGEALGYTRDGVSLVATSEGLRAPVHIMRGVE